MSVFLTVLDLSFWKKLLAGMGKLVHTSEYIISFIAAKFANMYKKQG